MTLLRTSWKNKRHMGRVPAATTMVRSLALGTVALLLSISAFAADKIWDAALADALANTASLIRGPYLQSGSSTGLTVCWRTSLATSSRIRYGTNSANLDRSTVDAVVTTNHLVSLTGLLPDTRYYYAPGYSTSDLPGATTNLQFITAPMTPKPFRVWAIGDPGTMGALNQTTGTNQIRVRDAYSKFAAAK